MGNPLRQEKEIFKYTITGLDDGQIKIEGPINNHLLTLKALNDATSLIIGRVAKTLADATKAKIVPAGPMIIPGKN